MCSLWLIKKQKTKKNAFTFSHWCYYAFTVTVFSVITGMVVLRVFPSCWKLHAFNQIQLEAYCAMVWRWFEAIFKLRPVISIFERNEMTECPRKPQQPASKGISWHIQPFSTQSARSVSYQFFFHSCASSWFSSQRTVNSMRRTLLWIGPGYNVRMLFYLNNVNWKW